MNFERSVDDASDVLRRVSLALAGTTADAVPDALRILRDGAAAAAAYGFVSRGGGRLELVAASDAPGGTRIVAMGDAATSDSWFPAEWPEPASALSVPIGPADDLKAVVVLAFPGGASTPSATAITPAMMLAGVALIERQRPAPYVEEYFRAAFDQVVLGMAIVTLNDARIVKVNRRFADILGRDEQELVGSTVDDLTAPEFREQSARVIAGACASEGAIRFEKAYVHRDGHRVWCEVGVTAIRDAEGRPQFCTAVIQTVAEKRQAMEALRRSEMRFRSLSECSPAGIFLSDVEGRSTYTNASLQEIFGCTLEESMDYGWLSFVHRDDAQRVAESWQRFVDGHASYALAYRITRRDGSLRWVDVAATALSGDDGTPIGYVGSIQDITSRKAFEQALRDSNERIVRILESITDAFFSVDHQWYVVYANEHAAEILDQPDMVGSGRTLWEIFPEAVDTEFYVAYHRAVETRKPEHLEAFLPEHGRWYEVHAYPSADGLSVYFRDVTERRRVEEELREREARFELVTVASEEMIWEWNMQTGQVWRSSAVETVFGYPLPEVRPDTEWWLSRIHPDDVERVRASVSEALAANLQFWSSEYRVRTGDGRWAFVLDRGSFVRDESGVPIRMMGARMDITRRKVAEQALEASREAARELARRLIGIQEEERRSIARDIHDVLGQALTAIKIDAVSMNRNVELPDDIRTRARRIADIVNDTVQDVRGMSARLRPIVLDDLGLLPALTTEARAFAERTGISCEVVNRAADLEVSGDVSTAVFRIVQEALTNVARHSEAHNVRIDILEDASSLQVRIEDDGRGITPDRDAASLGIIGMKERALLIGAELAVEHCSGGGTVVSLRIPGAPV